MVGYKGQLKDDPVYDTARQAELTSIWSDHLIGRPENHMTGVSFSRGGYHRIGKVVSNGAGGYTIHRPDHWLFEGTGLDVRRRARRRRRRSWATSATAATSPTSTACPCPPAPTARRPTSRSSAPRRPPTSTATTATRPPKPHEPSELEFIAARLFGTRDPAAAARIAHGHAVLGSYVARSGGTVVTSGSTDWAHGLAGRDPQVEQITRNLLDRLSGP